MLVLGLRFFRWYVRVGVAIAGWFFGSYLATQMHVTQWIMGLATTLVVLLLSWSLVRFAAPVLMGLASGGSLGTLFADGLEITNFWVAFAVGAVVGVVLAVVASRFTIALFCAACGTLSVIAALGAVAGAASGWLAPGGYVDYPVIYVVVGAVLFVAAIIAQVALEPDTPLAGRQDY
jgi:hypothetical protein